MQKKYKYEVSYRASLGKGSDGKYHYKRFTGHSSTSEQKALDDAKRQAERWKALHETPRVCHFVNKKAATNIYKIVEKSAISY